MMIIIAAYFFGFVVKFIMKNFAIVDKIVFNLINRYIIILPKSCSIVWSMKRA